MLLYRLLSAFIGLPIAIALAWVGGLPFAIAICVLAILAACELIMAFDKAGIDVVKEVALPCLVAGIIGTFMFANEQHILLYLWSAIIFLSVFGSMSFHIAFHDERKQLGSHSANISATVFTVVYVGMFAFMVMLRESECGRELMLLSMLTAWGMDAVAYFVGRWRGGRKICERVSPGKTVLGSVSGLITAVLLAPSLAFLFQSMQASGTLMLSTAKVFPIGLIIGTLGQVGDMCKSVIKRDVGIKDFGNIIPGHGGVLDRFDSLLISTPLVYFYALIAL
ncbi:MAG: hypothetical protein RUDDFDWM_002045 [Candidatus Fervidibacterota bacterium]